MFVCVCVGGGVQAEGRVSSSWLTQNNKKFTINHRSASRALTAPVAAWGDFLMFHQQWSENRKEQGAKNSVQGPDMTLQEILYFPPVEVQGVKKGILKNLPAY